MVAGICESNRFGGSQRSRSKSLACQGCDYFQSREENILNINGSCSCVNNDINDITDVDQTHGCNHLAELFLSRFCQPVYGHRSHYLLSLHSLINSVYCILFCIPKFFELRAYLSCEDGVNRVNRRLLVQVSGNMDSRYSQTRNTRIPL